jgi:hypothetical protein
MELLPTGSAFLKGLRMREVSANNSSPIHAFGLFWKIDEINWFPGKGKRKAFRLLGRQGKNLGKLKMADFRGQRGIYILYGNYGPYYAGLTRRQTLGKRLQDHLKDEHEGLWDRFCWFGYNQVLKAVDNHGLHLLKKKMPKQKWIEPHTAIKEMEALLIKAMALRNRADSKFVVAEEWYQVKMIEADKFLTKLK